MRIFKTRSLSQENVAALPGVAGWAKILENRYRSLSLSWEMAMYATLLAAAVLSRFWELGVRVLSYDESLHAYYSWWLAAGRGYVHNPMMHGPLLFEATALNFLLFGVGNLTARIFPALIGVFLVIGVPLLLRPWLGKAGSLAAALLLLISPYLLYYSRYIRHDILVIAWALLAAYAILSYLSRPQGWRLVLLAAAEALMFASMEISFIYLAIFAAYLVVRSLARYGLHWAALRAAPEFDLLVVLATLGAFFSAPIALLALNPLWSFFTHQPFVDLSVLAGQGLQWSAGVSGLRLWGLLAFFAAAAIAIGLWWGGRRWLKLAGLFAAITLLLFTTFFTNPGGVATGLIGSLGYWLSQQGVDRGSQPFYYFLIVFPLYEYLSIFGGLAGVLFYLTHKRRLSEESRLYVPFVGWWAAGMVAGLTLAGEKMPWHSTHLTVPFILLAGWWIGQLIQGHSSQTIEEPRRVSPVRIFSLAVVGLLALLTARTAYLANYVNYDLASEFIDYARGAPGGTWIEEDLATLGQALGAGNELKVAYGQSVAWPMSWYLREDAQQIYYGNQPGAQILNAQVILAGSQDWDQVDRLTQGKYDSFQVIYLWWPMEDYKNLTWPRIRAALSDPHMRQALWDIFWARNYTLYAGLTGEQMDPPNTWPLQESLRVYIRNDIPIQKLHLHLAPYQIAELPQ